MKTKRVFEAAPFRKKRLAEQVADHLRLAIRRGIWKRELPTERVLARQLGISQPVLNEALHRLQDEGMIAMQPRRAARIVGRRSVASHPADRRVAFLRPAPQSFESLLILDALRMRLYKRRCELELVTDLRLPKRRSPGAVLEQMVRHYEANHWILSSVTEKVQAWFQARRIPSVILGHRFPGVRVPSVDIDHRAVARHAAGVFLGLGHKRIALLIYQGGYAGDLAMEEGFQDAFQGITPAAGCVVRHSGQVQEIQTHLRRLLDESQPPTALLVSHAADMLPVHSALLQWGYRIPQHISLLSRERQPFLERITPLPSHYKIDPGKLANSLLRLIDHPDASGGQIRLLSSLVRGSTLDRKLP